MTEFTDGQIDLLIAVYNLAHRLEHTKDPAKIADDIDRLSELKSKLIGPGATKKEAGGQP
jgi:hypothetical protein